MLQLRICQTMRFWMISSVVAALFSSSIGAQSYPSKPIRIVVAFAPGGTTDFAARTLAQKLTEAFGQSVIVDNRPGGGGIIGTELVAKSSPDGHTLLMGTAANAAQSSLVAKLPYDFSRDFLPVSLVITVPGVLVVNPSLPVKSLQELIALAKSQPGKLTYASAGNGSTPHLSGALLCDMARVNILHVPYKGGPPALTDVVSGNVDLMINSVPSILSLVQSKRLTAIAVTGAERSKLLPSVPTFSEAGLPGYEMGAWQGVLAPANTAKAIVATLTQQINKVMRLHDVQSRLLEQGATPSPGTPESFAALIRQDTEKFAKLVKTTGIKAE